MAANIYDPKYRRALALEQGNLDTNINIARYRTELQYDELGPVELEQNVDDANKIAREKEQGLGLELRPLRGLPPINRGNAKTLQPGAGWTTIVQNYHSPPEDAEMIAITIGIVGGDDVTNANQSMRVDLRVEWGMGGANFDAMLDGYDGLVFCLPACKLKIDARYKPIEIDNVPPSRAITVNGSLAYGFFSGESTPTRLTHDLGVIQAGQFVQDTIPPWATSFTVFSTPTLIVGSPPFPLIAQPPTSIVVSETDLVALNERKAYFELTDNSNLSWHTAEEFPLFNGARVITISNNGSSSSQNASYIILYGLSF